MIIKSILVEQFRSFENLSFKLGKRVTAIAGRNATQKTTLLGLLGQPFTISSKEHPMYGAKTIDGYNFKSQFSDKFKISPNHDIIGKHRWTLYFFENICEHNSYSVVSIARKQKGHKPTLRFWNAKSRDRGAGYVQIPVYFLSLSRLFPIGESGKTQKLSVRLTNDEIAYYEKNYRQILSIQSTGAESSLSIEKGSSAKVFAGINDGTHDIYTNSAGEGNISRIIIAVLSFKRLKEMYGNNYKGGLLLIDELDATLYGYSQRKLVDYLLEESRTYKIQIVFTTHSPIVLKRVNDHQENERLKKGNIPNDAYESSIVYLKPTYKDSGERLVVAENIYYRYELTDALNDINLSVGSLSDSKIIIYCEDQEARAFIEFALNQIIGRRYLNLMIFFEGNLGWSNFVYLASKKVGEFTNNIVILDHDVLTKTEYINNQKNIVDRLDNFLFLPLTIERDIFRLLKEHDAYNRFVRLFQNSRVPHYDICFNEWTGLLDEYSTDEVKSWYKHIVDILDDRTVLFDFWCKENESVIHSFVNDFVRVFNIIAKRRDLDRIILEPNNS